MPTSQAKIAANRRNAARSTGPRTVEGKNRSRTNALDHGLTARVLRTAEEVAIIGEPPERPPGFLGTGPLDRSWIVEEVKLLSLRVERARKMEIRLRERATLRVSVCTDRDRNPAEIAARLESTPQGCRMHSDTVNRATALADDLGIAGKRLLRYDAELQRRLRIFHEILEENPFLGTISELSRVS